MLDTMPELDTYWIGNAITPSVSLSIFLTTKLTAALLRPYALCGQGRLSVTCPSILEMTTNLAISEDSSRGANDWKRTKGPIVLMVKSAWMVSVVTVLIGCTPELTPIMVSGYHA